MITDRQLAGLQLAIYGRQLGPVNWEWLTETHGVYWGHIIVEDVSVLVMRGSTTRHDWFKDFQCSWRCRAGYSETGLSCMPTVNMQIPSMLPWGLAVLVLIFLACMLTRHTEEPEPPPPPPAQATMVQFNKAVMHAQIRVKIH